MTEERGCSLTGDPYKGKRSLNRVVGLGGSVVLSVAFIKQAYMHSIDPMAYLFYALGLAMCMTPTLAATFLSLKFGGKEEK